MDSSLQRLAKKLEKEKKQKREHEAAQAQQGREKKAKSTASQAPQSQQRQQTARKQQAPSQTSDSEARDAKRAKQVHDAVTALRKARSPLSESEVEQRSGCQLTSDSELRAAVRQNEKVVECDNGKLQYKPYLTGVFDQSSLETVLQQYPNGLTHYALEDAYDGVMDDVHSLANEGRAILVQDLSMHSKHNEVVYPPEPEDVALKVDDDVQQLFRSFKLPHDEVELKQALSKAGIQPAPRRSRSVYRPSNDSRKRMRRQNSSSKKSNGGQTNLKTLQNSHVLDLLTEDRSAPAANNNTAGGDNSSK